MMRRVIIRLGTLPEGKVIIISSWVEVSSFLFFQDIRDVFGVVCGGALRHIKSLNKIIPDLS
jgi:hypothetical protein